MNWIGMVVGAGAGAVAVVLSMGILKLLGKSNSKSANVLHVVVFAAALALGREFVEPNIRAQQVESGLLELPIYRALQQYEPESYKRVVAAIEEGTAKQWPQERTWAVTRPILGEVAAKRLPHASDPVLIRFAEHLINATTLLHAKEGTACFSYVNPAPGEAVDFATLLGREVANHELNLVAEVVTSAAGTSRPPVAEAEVAADMETVLVKLLQKYSQEELLGLQNLQAPNLDKRKYCQIISDLYRESVALAEPNNSRLVRYLMQGQ